MENIKMVQTILKRRSLFDDFFNDTFFPSIPYGGSIRRYSTRPNVNIEETEKEYVIDVAAPGLDKKDFKINLDKNFLSISATKKSENNVDEENYICREFNYDSFSRSFSLPEGIDSSKIKATHKNGVLRVYIPKNKVQDKIQKEIKIS
jgi:HSP20 family protein